jgi:uncharacterized repeat protein (TIGR01451 family)
MRIRSIHRGAGRAAVAGVVVLGVGALAATGPVAHATTVPPTASDPTVRLTTPYPALSVEPGNSVKLDLSAHAPQPERVDLTVQGLPDGWKAILRGGGFVIAGLTAGPDTAGTAQLELDVPADAAPADYPISVVETAPQGTSQLDLTVTVAQEVDNGVKLTADFPSLSGGPTDAFDYNLTVANNTPTQQSFNFTGSGPDGWTVTVSPSAESRANTVQIDAGSTATVKVVATPPASIQEGSYPINVQITGAAGGQGSIQLTAQVTGTAKLEMATSDQRLNLSGNADSTSKETIVVSNSGTAPLQQVTFSATPPAGWQVTFAPDSLANVAPGQTQQVVATVKPSKSALAGDYAINVAATAGSQHPTLDLRYTVKTSTSWALIGIIVVVLGALALFFGYRILGRR